MYTIIHAIVGYFLLLLVVRVLARRPGGQLTPFEFVIVFLIGGVIILATVGDDRSVTNCVCAIITVGLMHRTTAGIRARSSRVGKLFDGVPMVLLNRGRWHTEAMQGMRLKDDDVMAAARGKGIRDLHGIRYAVLERVGSISVMEDEKSDEAEEEGESEPGSNREAGSEASSQGSEKADE